MFIILSQVQYGKEIASFVVIFTQI